MQIIKFYLLFIKELCLESGKVDLEQDGESKNSLILSLVKMFSMITAGNTSVTVSGVCFNNDASEKSVKQQSNNKCKTSSTIM